MDVLLESALRITVLIASVALGLRALRVSAPRAAHRAWTGVCLVMLALPAIVAWAPRAMVPVLSAPDVAVHQWPALGLGAALPPASIETQSVTPLPAVWWPTLVAAVYVAGVVLLLWGVARGWWQSRRLVRQARLVEGRLTHARCVAPVTVGLWRPVVILPPDWPTWDEHELAAVLAHEEEHARRRDPLVALLTLTARAVFWFHPLAWWLRRRIATLSEQACDAVVISGGHDAGGYASTLLRFARAVSASGGRLAPPVLGMTGSSLRQRLNVLDAPAARATTRRQRLCRAVVYVAVATACAIATPTRAQSRPAGPGSDSTQWQTFTSEHFDIRYLPHQRPRISDVAASAERAYARLAARFKYELVQRVSVILVENNEDMKAGAAAARDLNERNGTWHPHVVMSTVLLDERPDAIVHELAHQFTFEIIPDANNRTPWLMEGLAEYQRGAWDSRQIERIRSAVLTSGIPDPDQLTDDDMLWGHALFDYVASKSGDEGVRRLLFALRSRPKPSAAIETALGETPDTFARGFADYVWARFGPR